MDSDPRQRLAQMPAIHPHNFSPRELTSLGVICDTLLPPMPGRAAESIALIQQLPDWVAGVMTQRLKPDKVRQLRLVLWLLGYPLGSFLLCGLWACSWNFPWVHSFQSLPQHRREAALLAWASSRFMAFRALFKAFKSYTCSLYATVLDAHGHNLVQDAIDYHPPSQHRAATWRPGERPPPGYLQSQSCGSDSSEDYPGPAAVAPVESFGVSQEQQGGGGEQEGEEPPLPVLRSSVVDAGLPAGRFQEEMRLRGFCCHDGSGSEMEGVRRRVGGLPEVSKVEPEQVTHITCDAVVIGSGCGGSVVACQLAQARPGSRVLILEKGRYYAGEEFSQLEAPSMTELYERGGYLTTSDGSMSVLSGSCVGGGSVINWGASFQTPAHVRREWAKEYGLKQFDTFEYDAAMEAVCQRIGVNDENTEHNLSNSVLREGCSRLGYPCETIPRNAPPPHPCGFCHFGCREGGKHSTAVTWLHDSIRSGSVIVSSARAERLLFAEGATGRKRAGGVLAASDTGRGGDAGGQMLVVEAPLVVVACGSFQTPALLLRSGLSNPNIGTHLRLHPVSGAWGYFPEDDPALRERFPQRNPNGGIMTLCSKVVGNWSTTGYGALIQTPTTHPGLISSVLPWFKRERYGDQLLRFSKSALLIAITRDSGRGRVYLDGKGDVAMDYDLNKRDTQSLKHGVRAALLILRAAGAHEVGTNHQHQNLTFDCTRPHTERDFELFLRRVEEAGFGKLECPLFSAHQMGSCPMGVSPEVSAVDENGEAWEASGLFLGDGSVFPSPSGVNPMVSIESVCFLIGVRLAKRFAGGEFSAVVADNGKTQQQMVKPKM